MNKCVLIDQLIDWHTTEFFVYIVSNYISEAYMRSWVYMRFQLLEHHDTVESFIYQTLTVYNWPTYTHLTYLYTPELHCWCVELLIVFDLLRLSAEFNLKLSYHRENSASATHFVVSRLVVGLGNFFDKSHRSSPETNSPSLRYITFLLLTVQSCVCVCVYLFSHSCLRKPQHTWVGLRPAGKHNLGQM